MFIKALNQCLKYKLIEFFPNENRKDRCIYTFDDEKKNYIPNCKNFLNLRQTCKIIYEMTEEMWLKNCHISLLHLFFSLFLSI